jgi:hypothetical protein
MLTATALTLALLAPAGAAQAELPVGESRGVRLERTDSGALVLVFGDRSGKLRERINSRYAWLSCTDLGDGVFSSGASGNLDASGHGRRFNTGFDPGPADYCRFFLKSHTVKRKGERRRVPRRVLFSIPLTQTGAVYLDEEAKAIRMLQVALVVSFAREEKKLPEAPTYAQLVRAYPRLARAVAALPGPADTPPPRRVGYYGDGQEHSVLAILSASGKRLFIEHSAGDVLTTNVAAHIFSDFD